MEGVNINKRLAAGLAPQFPTPQSPCDNLQQAQAYCRRLARSHYENFTVASWLLPRQLRQHFANVYAYCRWADDLADEAGGPAERLALLDGWEAQLNDCYRGRAEHPVFVALAETIEEFAIPPGSFHDLLLAFRQDQRQTRYETFEDLLGYCRNSANPVGRLVLYLGRVHNRQTAGLSDSICTGLQLANFWQDVARDCQSGRVYLPKESMRRFGYQESQLAQGETNEEFRQLMAFEVERARTYLTAGTALVEMVPKELRVDVELFIRGGLAILQAIERLDYNVLAKRPTVGKWEKFRQFVAAWWNLNKNNHGTWR